MRIIVEKEVSSTWTAWWADDPENRESSASVQEAIAKLLNQSPQRSVTIDDLVADASATTPDHIEMVMRG